MKKLRMLSLCSGIGGADLAAEWTEAIEVVGQVEIDPFCQAILARHWPHVKRLCDIRKVHGHEFGDIDIIVAGFPCQPHSLAGKRRGSRDERNLWPEVKRIIGAAHPRWFVGENVPGVLSVESGRFFTAILADLVAQLVQARHTCAKAMVVIHDEHDFFLSLMMITYDACR